MKRYNVLTPDDTTTILGIYSISADLIVGADGTKTYNQDDVIADGDSAKFIYFPVTVDSAGNEADEGPDLTVVYDYKDPTGIVTYSDADDTVFPPSRGDDEIKGFIATSPTFSSISSSFLVSSTSFFF